MMPEVPETQTLSVYPTAMPFLRDSVVSLIWTSHVASALFVQPRQRQHLADGPSALFFDVELIATGGASNVPFGPKGEGETT